MIEAGNTYFSNGLIIRSIIPFPEMNLCEDKPHIQVLFGDIPEKISQPIFVDDFQQISDNEYRLSIPTVADYWMKDHSTVYINKHTESNIDDVRMYFLASVLPLLVHSYQLLPLHSCCININNHAFLVGGESGSGKSTLALGMYQKGYTILNDDVSTLDFNETNELVAHPGYQQIKLLPESLKYYGLDKEKFEILGVQLEKYKFPLEFKFDRNTIPVKALFFYDHKENLTEIEIKEIKGFEALMQVTKHTFRNQFIHVLGKQKQHFQLCSKLLENVKVFKISRPKDIAVQTFADCMERTFLNLI